MITVFSNARDIWNPRYVEEEYVLKQIQNCKIQKQINAIRGEKDVVKKRELKTNLPSICWSGTFTKREDKYCTTHSGMCVLDYDHLENVNTKKDEMKKYPFVFCSFISPSGDGLKVVVKIPPEKEKHYGYYAGLVKMFPELDPTSKNISRVCFASADKDIYINKGAIEFTEYIDPNLELQKANTLGGAKKAFNTDYAKANISLNMIRNSLNGEKHGTLLKASKLMGGYIAGGVIEEDEAFRLLEIEIQKKEIDDFDGAKKTIQDGINYGKITPLFQIEEEIKLKATNTGIKKADEVWEKMKHGFRNGKERGVTTHFDLFNDNFTWKRGEISLIIGRPNSGKTEFMLQLMLLKSYYDGWKWGVFSPENYPEDEFYDSLIHSYIGKTTDPYFNNYQMSEDEYEKGYEFIRKHFFYIYPDDIHTIEEIESNFLYLIENEGISGTFIDPFNQIISPSYGKRDDQFLSLFLSQRKKFAVRHQLCDVISSHPKIMMKNKNNGEYDVPDIYDIAGGAMWSNKIDNIISVHRPNYVANPKDTSVEIHVKKIKKQRLVGIPGMCLFDFNRKTNRYYINGLTAFEKNISGNAPIQTSFYETQKEWEL